MDTGCAVQGTSGFNHDNNTYMLRYNDRIRLTRDELDTLERLTGTAPDGIMTIAELNRFVDQHVAIHPDDTPEGCLLRLLLLDFRGKTDEEQLTSTR